MNKLIKTGKQFDRQLQRLSKKKPDIFSLLINALMLLMDLEFKSESLRVHKLKGDLKDHYAFSLTYDLRVVFKWEGKMIILISIGSHDEVY